MELYAIKRPNGFQPCDGFNLEEFEKLHNGQTYHLKVTQKRNGKYHNKFLKMVRTAFDYWEPDPNLLPEGVFCEKDFESFRKKIMINSGFYTQVFDINGNFELVPQSIKWSKLDNTQFEIVYNAVAETIMNSSNVVPEDPVLAAGFRELIMSFL